MNTRFKRRTYSSSTFLSPSQVHALCKSELKLRNYVLLIPTLPHVPSFSQAHGCRVSFTSRTEFPSWWDHVLFINTRVNVAERYISAKRAGIFIRGSQNTWGFRLWLERNFQPVAFGAFIPTHNNLFTTPLLVNLLSFLVVRTPTLSFFFERAYWYRNLDPFSRKISYLYPFLYFGLKRLFFIVSFISFYFMSFSCFLIIL